MKFNNATIVGLGILVCLSGVAVFGGAQAPQATSAPYLQYDDTFLNTSYIDLILDFTNLEDFDGGLQTNWRFLRRLCGDEAIYRDFYRQYSLHRLPTPVGQQWKRCEIGDSSVGTFTMPSIMIKLSSRGLAVIPYMAYQQYLIALVFRGTQQQLYNFTQMILETEKEAMLVMGIGQVMALPDDQGDVYSGGQVYLTVDTEATLSVAWYIIIISFFFLVLGIVFTFIMRSKNHRTEDASGAANPDDDWLDEDDEEEMNGRTAERWQGPDVEMLREELDKEASLLEPDKVKHFAEAYSQPLISQQLECDKRMKYEDEVQHHDDTVSDFGNSPLSPSTAANVTLRNNRKKRDKNRYSPQVFEDALAFEPSLNMPPEDRAVRATKSLQDRIRDKKRDADEAKKKRADKERKDLMADVVTTDLPPEQEELEMIRRLEHDKKSQSLPPMGLASRRMAAMMSTIAVNPHTTNSGVVSAGSVGPMMGGMVSSSARRTVLGLPTAPSSKPKNNSQEEGDESPGLLALPQLTPLAKAEVSSSSVNGVSHVPPPPSGSPLTSERANDTTGVEL